MKYIKYVSIAVLLLSITLPFFLSAIPVIPTIPEQNVYNIRTRIVIEFMNFNLKNNQEDEEYSILYTDILERVNVQAYVYAVKIDEIKNQIRLANNIYKNINFSVQEIIFKKSSLKFEDLEKDALEHPNYLSIYYMLPNNFDKELSGLSSAPWERNKHMGIFISKSIDEYTLSHEIGHYFGLCHTFTEDHCNDTPAQTNELCTDESQPNCGNIMNYCPHLPKKITQEQKDRMIGFIRKERSNHVMTEKLKSTTINDLEIISRAFPVEFQ